MKIYFILLMFAIAVGGAIKSVLTEDIFKADMKTMIAIFKASGMALAYYWLACLILGN